MPKENGGEWLSMGLGFLEAILVVARRACEKYNPSDNRSENPMENVECEIALLPSFVFFAITSFY